jgi:hypothetical protein
MKHTTLKYLDDVNEQAVEWLDRILADLDELIFNAEGWEREDPSGARYRTGLPNLQEARRKVEEARWAIMSAWP